MTRKDYELIAGALKDAEPTPYYPDYSPNEDLAEARGWEGAVQRVCQALSDDNPRFDSTFRMATPAPPSA